MLKIWKYKKHQIYITFKYFLFHLLSDTMKKNMDEPHMIEVTAEDVYEALAENMDEDELEKKFSKLSDDDIDEIIGNIDPSDIYDAIYDSYCDVVEDSADDEYEDNEEQ